MDLTSFHPFVSKCLLCKFFKKGFSERGLYLGKVGKYENRNEPYLHIQINMILFLIFSPKNAFFF